MMYPTIQRSPRSLFSRLLQIFTLPGGVIVLCSFLAASAQAGVVAEDQLITPLAPSTFRNHIKLSAESLDPAKPIWVAYQLIAVSASDNPTGKIVLEASPEGVPVDIKDLKVVFLADKLKQSESAGTIGTLLEAQVGKRSPQELTEVLGPELYAAFQALNEKRGAILQGTKVKTYGPTGTSDATMLVSIEVAEGMQPMLIKVTMGQGDMPPEVAAAAETRLPLSTLLLGALGIGIALAWFRWRR